MEDSGLRGRIRDLHRADDAQVLSILLPLAEFDAAAQARIGDTGMQLLAAIRGGRARGVDALLRQFDLSAPEGLALLGLAEALLRIPDGRTADALLRDRLAGDIPHGSDSTLAGALQAARALLPESDATLLDRLRVRLGTPLLRRLALVVLRQLGRHFVLGRDMTEALRRGRRLEARGWRLSCDMLGEAARTALDARRYFEAYRQAIAALGQREAAGSVATAPGISVKLSALHPRYEFAQRQRVMAELLPAALELARQAKARGLGFTLDAEESDRLELSLDILEALALDGSLAGWDGLGLAVQAYQKRASAVIDWLAELSRRAGRRFMVRLVKGAYWDTEIKLAQERGLPAYPVFTRKACTDVSWLACARKLLADPAAFHAQFASHNAQSVASIMEMAGGPGDWEFQCLFGMGGDLYAEVLKAGYPCRLYAPVGGHRELLPYLVRRLLENGAGVSFVNRQARLDVGAGELLADPVQTVAHLDSPHHPAIPLPAMLYGAERKNSTGRDLWDGPGMARLEAALAASRQRSYRAAPEPAPTTTEAEESILNPASHSECVGNVVTADEAAIESALSRTDKAWRHWDATPADTRAACLERTADLAESSLEELAALIVREGGRAWPDAVSEVREAVDFCRYYAVRCRADFGAPRVLPGPAGERNELSLHGRGVCACISPWNFPLAIFTGQVAAALAAGNALVAKPAEQTPLIAARAVALLHEAGIPADVLCLLPGGRRVGTALVTDERVAGVAFTGSTITARSIARSLAERPGPLTPFIAETGGLNALIADSSALPEQLVRDVIHSAFNSAGQRCSALRLLWVQEDIAAPVMDMLAGAMAELAIGDPARLSTDLGPVIDANARAALESHVARLEGVGRLIYRCTLPEACRFGTFFPPQAWEIRDLSVTPREVFGPILHVLRWKADHLDEVLEHIDATSYGLTLGIHSRVGSFVRQVTGRLRVGNTYVNRNMIGAVVGVQPFGGERLSGTGPKAGGPFTLLRYATERSLSIDTTAAGGNASLLALGD